MLKLVIGIIFALVCTNAFSVESSLKGVVDVRAVLVDGADNSNSYLAGDYGKFRYSDGEQLTLDQLGLQYKLDWENNWSLNVVANGVADEHDVTIGVTEAYAQYKGLPNDSGWRMQAKLGLYYPHISLENVATAWSTPYTLTSSAINNWIGEELRSTGVNVKFEKLGRFSNSDHSFAVDLDVFQNNDTAGAMITWHGWTIGSRQTSYGETLKLQDFPARTGKLSAQAGNSDPFLELDDRWGYNVSGQWKYKNDLTVNLGYYDNQAEKGIVIDGQYTWTTAFVHAGFKYKVAKGWEVLGQFMQGNTLMTSPYLKNVVNNDFDSYFVMLRHFWQQHHVALRLESYSVDDLDQTVGDNNNEKGDALALAYRYRFNRQTFILAEYTMTDSNRWSRYYEHQPIQLTEHQYQLGLRYYF